MHTFYQLSYCLNPDCKKPQNLEYDKICINCGSKLLLGDRYRALKPIGQGCFGRTFLAVDEYKPSKPNCVIKQFFPQDTNHLEKASALFRQEAVRLDELGKHPQIPELLAYFTQDHRQYLVQEFIDGQNLAQELTSGAFTESQIRQLLNDLLLVLQFVHARQVIHRDVKPENIIRRSRNTPEVEGNLVLVDFGASKLITGITTRNGTTIGSAMYAAPEQMNGQAVFASDLYSLGVTCIYLATCVDPFYLYDSHECTWVWRNFLVNNPISSQLGQILDKLLQPVNRRYQSAVSVLNDLQQRSISQSQLSPVTLCWVELEPLSQVQWQENSTEISPQTHRIHWRDI